MKKPDPEKEPVRFSEWYKLLLKKWGSKQTWTISDAVHLFHAFTPNDEGIIQAMSQNRLPDPLGAMEDLAYKCLNDSLPSIRGKFQDEVKPIDFYHWAKKWEYTPLTEFEEIIGQIKTPQSYPGRPTYMSEVDTLFWTPFLRENKTPAKKRCLDEQTTIETVYPRVQGSSS
uniref:Uncharacterized protein n=1 Tax=Magnetococcus massalia (strain MO-1) TaxID=451514 RepID=A0A1S7LLV8_MAGMO|nr:protein of unknown function [Candidatus Magnetococcus massalia]